MDQYLVTLEEIGQLTLERRIARWTSTGTLQVISEHEWAEIHRRLMQLRDEHKAHAILSFGFLLLPESVQTCGVHQYGCPPAIIDFPKFKLLRLWK